MEDVGEKNADWEQRETVVVETGFNDEGLCMGVYAGENIALPAADLGIEAFMIDAGWFGEGEG